MAEEIERDELGDGWTWYIFHEQTRRMYSANVYYHTGNTQTGVTYFGPLCATIEEVQNLKRAVIRKAREAFVPGQFVVVDDRQVIRG
jgi:hypothetical protein